MPRFARLAPTLLPALLLALLPAAPALAWSELGHRIVGELAERGLTPEARAEVARLLEGEEEPSLAAAAVWADKVRPLEGFKHTAPWHYLNFPDGAGCDYAPARDCPGGDCVVGAIRRARVELANPRASRQQRVEALKFLAHFVGDVHQPLHAGFGSDRGGNEFQVNIDGEGTNLHGVWDWWIISTRERDALAYADLLAPQGLPVNERDAVQGLPEAGWAEESCRIVREPGFYPEDRRLGPVYFDRWRPTAEMRMREAAGRLAAVLNEVLGER